jgi:hypothetical protein
VQIQVRRQWIFAEGVWIKQHLDAIFEALTNIQLMTDRL